MGPPSGSGHDYPAFAKPLTLAASLQTSISMKIYLTLFLSLIFVQTVFCQSDTVLINGVKFLTVKQTVKTEYEKKDTLLKLFSLKNGKRQYLFSHYLFQYGGDVENEFKNIGTIQFTSDSIILKTHTFQKGLLLDPIPESRKQIYKVTTTGKLLLLYDKCRQRNSKTWMSCPNN